MLYVVQILNTSFPAKHGSWKLWIYINFLMFALILNLNKHEPSYTAWRNSKSPAFQLQYIWQPLIQCVGCRLSICSHFGWVWQIISEWYGETIRMIFQALRWKRMQKQVKKCVRFQSSAGLLFLTWRFNEHRYRPSISGYSPECVILCQVYNWIMLSMTMKV